MAFTIRYMARKNLIQFWVSTHFSRFHSPTPTHTSPDYVIIIAISVVRLNAPQFFLWLCGHVQPKRRKGTNNSSTRDRPGPGL